MLPSGIRQSIPKISVQAVPKFLKAGVPPKSLHCLNKNDLLTLACSVVQRPSIGLSFTPPVDIQVAGSIALYLKSLAHPVKKSRNNH
jgi:hypothetical protein